jgi:hypothetical protein
MQDSLHVHNCPRCNEPWKHQCITCTLGTEHVCDRCSGESGGAIPTVTGDEWRLMHHLDIHTRQELDNFLSSQSPDYLVKWIEEEEARINSQSYWMDIELEEIRYQVGAYSDANLKLETQRVQKDLTAAEQDWLELDFLARKLKICYEEIAGRWMEQFELPQKCELPIAVGGTEVKFVVQLSEFSKALRYLRPARAKGRKAQADCVDLNVRAEEVEIVAPGVSFSLPAQVILAGYARVPYLTFEWFSRALKTLRQPSVEVAIIQGQVKTANLTFKHPDITTRLIGARIADLPIDAPLADVLALLAKYRPEELSDSGLLARVLAAQETASALIDRAMKVLARLKIKREELSQFIMDQIKKRSQLDT